MSQTDPIHTFNHHAMATHFQVRIAGEDAAYAGQSARAAIDLVDRMETLLSRFRESSEISQIARLQPGQRMRLSEPVFACLRIAREMETATRGAFSVTPAARQTQLTIPRWTLDPEESSIRCEEGRLEMDLGAIGKGFALDRMAEELAEWECSSYLLIAGGSSILAGDPPPGMPGWDSGIGDGSLRLRYWLSHASLSGSGVSVKGLHILDPRTGQPATKRPRAWAMASSAAVSDSLSTACMVLEEAEVAEIMAGCSPWLTFLDNGTDCQIHGARAVPPSVNG